MTTVSWYTKIRSNRIASVTLVMLMVTSVLAMLAYLVIPDKSHNANRQILQLALKAPGSAHKICYQAEDARKNNQGQMSAMIVGKRDNRIYYPYDEISYRDGETEILYEQSLISREGRFETKKLRFLLGSDKFGRDVLSRLILGLRVSLTIGFLAVIVSLFIGIFIGSIGAYYGGWADQVVMIIINTSWSIPTLLLAFAIILSLGKGYMVIVLAVGLTMWVDVARLVRGQIKEEREKPYVASGKVLGLSDVRIVVRHILPNILAPILVIAAANFATAILVEAGLSYLGLGIQPPAPSLGNMLKENYAYATGGYVYLAMCPIIMIMFLVLNFNLLGTALRDVFDYKSKTR